MLPNEKKNRKKWQNSQSKKNTPKKCCFFFIFTYTYWWNDRQQDFNVYNTNGKCISRPLWLTRKTFTFHNHLTLGPLIEKFYFKHLTFITHKSKWKKKSGLMLKIVDAAVLFSSVWCVTVKIAKKNLISSENSLVNIRIRIYTVSTTSMLFCVDNMFATRSHTHTHTHNCAYNQMTIIITILNLKMSWTRYSNVW